MDHKMSRSPWVIHYDGSSCNGCDIEVLASLTPLFDAERFGVVNTGNPKHADIFLVTGSVNAQNLPVVRQIYNQMLEPKCVVACGICACSGGVFRDAYNVIGGVDRAIPVDVYARVCHSPRDHDRCHRGGVRHPGPEGGRDARRRRSAYRGRCRYLGRWC